jgi:ABC-type molybdenum transport system ATPase subunit/photorepair protein PhrA
MWRRTVQQARRSFYGSARTYQDASRPIIAIDNATFYSQYPSSSDTSDNNPPLLEDFSFQLASNGTDAPQQWSVISPSSLARTTFLQILAGQHICIPSQARSYPYLSSISQSPHSAIKYVGFDADRGNSVGGTNVRGAYLSARYESRREETDFSVYDYLTGHTELNALEPSETDVDEAALAQVIEQLNLRQLLQMPVANLSNGQTRRARIAKALMARPEVLLLDGPFMGLDPNTLLKLSEVLRQLAVSQQPRLIMSLRPEDGVPAWVSHLVVMDDKLQVLAQGAKNTLVGDGTVAGAAEILRAADPAHAHVSKVKVSRDGFERHSPPLPPGEALVSMQGVKVAYGDKVVLGDWVEQTDAGNQAGLHWSLHRGQRCAILGPNGSGKTTMLSLITSDHPQTYSLPIKLFGRSRLPGPGQPGISLFDIQRRMGHSSPEVHAFFPKQVSVRRALESAWADAALSKPVLSAAAKKRVTACLRWFASELDPRPSKMTELERLEGLSNVNEARQLHAKLQEDTTDLDWASKTYFRELSFSNQRLVLFLRAIIASPDLVILDEALSGIDERTRDKALLFLSQGESVRAVVDDVAQRSMIARIGEVCIDGLSPEQALLVISHSKEDVPGCIREWICLPEPGEGKAPREGALPGPLELNPETWNDIWGR